MRIFRLLSQLLDVEIVNPVDNDRLQYETASGKWKNTSVSGVAPHHGSHEEGGDDEVSVTVGMIDAEASTDGQVPTSDGAGGVSWEDQSGSGGSVAAADVTFTPAGTIAASDTQSAVEEVATDAAAAVAALSSVYQPLDSDLTSIAALSTTSFGRGLLILANQAALLSAAGAAAASHTHAESDVTNLTTDLAAKQPLDSDLTAIAALTPTNDDIVQRKAGAWTNRTIAQLLTDLAAAGTTFQPLDSDLTSIAALTTTSFGRSLLTLADAAALLSAAGATTAAAALTAALTEIADQKRVVEILVSDPGGSAITTGDSKAYMRIPTLLNGHNLVSVGASVTTVSSSGIPTVQLRRMRLTNATTQAAADMLSTKLTVDASEFDSSNATAAVIDTSNDDVQTGDQIHVDVDVAGTGTKGLLVTMTFEAP